MPTAQKKPRDFAKIKIDKGSFENQKEYKRLWGMEYNKDPKRLALVSSPEYKEYMRQYSKKYRSNEEYKQKKNEKTRTSRSLLRLEILTHYSNGTIECSCCGFSDIRALDLDHVNDNGGEHRRSIGRRGATYDIYAALKKEGFPEGYQILCRNCNWIKECEKRENTKDLAAVSK